MIKLIGGNVPPKRIPKNPKYEGVKPVVDSGPNIMKQAEKYDDSKINARFRREEFFRRLKPAALARLIQEERIDFLLLDLRDEEAFQANHIQGAMSYPAPRITRAVNPFSAEILAYINKEPERIILIYDEDEKVAAPAGNLFYEKNVDNVFLVSGGIRAVAADYPELVDGALPQPPSPTASLARSVRSSSLSSRPGVKTSVASPSSRRSTSDGWQSSNGHSPRSVSRSVDMPTKQWR